MVCEACGSIQPSERELTPFEVLGLEPSMELDEGHLRKRLLRLSRLTHPDFFAGSDPEGQGQAERASAALNAANKQLADPVRRADWLVGWLGGPGESEERQMPQAFLMEVLEWNETLEEARADARTEGAHAALDALEAELGSRRAECLEALTDGLTPLPERGDSRLTDLRRDLNALRYIDRTMGEIRSLRLSGGAPTR